MAKIYEEIPDCIIGQFSKMKFVNGSNFKKFKEYFLAEYNGGFIVPADTFDNVKGNFPIGFTIWNTSVKNKISIVATDVYSKKGEYQFTKGFYGNLPQNINRWIKIFDNKTNIGLGFMGNPAPDFQHNSQLYISNTKGKEHFNFFNFISANIFEGTIYFSVRNTITQSWLNDRDQFLYPKDGWQEDTEFQTDCLAFTLFHGQNRITNKEGINHWIPFTEQEVNAQEKFESNFMTNFIKSKLPQAEEVSLFGDTPISNQPLAFSEEAKAVFDAGRELWKYYHAQPNVNVNASYYDIREYFQGRNDKGKMNAKSLDQIYTNLNAELKNKMSILADKIKPKIYEYEFLKE